MSGLQVGGRHDPLLVSLLVDYVAGYLGGQEDHERKMARYVVSVRCNGSLLRSAVMVLRNASP